MGVEWRAGAKPLSAVFWLSQVIGVGREGAGGGGGGGGGGAIIWDGVGGGGKISFGPPNNPPTISFSFYVKQEKIAHVPSWRVK